MKWLTIVGIGEDGLEGLSAKARHAIEAARNIIGSKRTLAMLPKSSAQHIEWPQPFSKVVKLLEPLIGEATVMLATGDPMNYGAARKIFEFTSKDEVTVIPHLSAFSLAAAELGWSLPDCDCLSIHGRPAANIEAFIQPNARLIVLTEDGTSVADVSKRLVARGFEESIVVMLENLGGPGQAITCFRAQSMPIKSWSPLNTLAILCIASPRAKIWSRVPGLPDDVFKHDGKITKPEVRAATIAALAPAPDQLLWDIGAGSGSIGIEWMRSTRGCEAHAIEHDDEQCAFIAANADQLGTPRLKIVKGKAPDALADLAQPHAIFIGGGLSDDGVFETAWQRLRSGGRLVANVVTLEGQQRLFELQKTHGGELVSMDVAVLTHVGDMRAMRPRMAVMQWRVTKP